MRTSKSRSRNKNRNRNQQSGGNIINRTFDSSGPEGKVRGTPAQIIEKYGQLARDAQLSGDRVAVENFQQHSEHYTRMLAAAQKEMDARQAQNNANQNANNQSHNQSGGQNNNNQSSGQQNNNQHSGQNNGQNGGQQNNNQGGGQNNGGQQDAGNQNNQQGGNRRRNDRGDNRPDQTPAESTATDVIEAPEADSGPVDTPETQEKPKADKPKRTRVRKKAPAKAAENSEEKTAGETGGLPAFIDPAEPAAES